MLTMPAGSKRISSGSSAFYKRMLPLIWYGIVLVVCVLLWNLRRMDPRLGWWMFLAPLFMAVMFHVLGKGLLADLVDEVWDNGQELIVVNEGHAEHVALKNIVNISYSGYTNPKRVTLTLRQAGRLGSKFSFIPPRSTVRFLSLGTNEMVDELIQRVDKVRA
jgi:hypothetical protein